MIVTQIPHHGVDEAIPSEPLQDAWYRIEPRELVEHFVVRGSILRDEPTAIRSPAAGVVTAVGAVASGDPVLELSGQPLFLLEGTFPGYRDLQPGLSGPDVAQLNSALSRLGHETSGDRFDEATEGAVEALFSRAGHETPRHVEPDLPGLQRQLVEERYSLEDLQLQHDDNAKERDRLIAAIAAAEDSADETPSAEDADKDALSADLARVRREHDQIHRQIDLSQTAVEELERRIEELIQREGVMFPQQSGIFAASADGLRLTVGVGDRVSQGDPVLVTAAGASVAELQLTPGQIEVLSPLLPTRVTLEAAEQSAEAIISSISTNGTSEIALGELQAAPGTPVRATVVLDESDGAVLALPVTALTRSGDEWTVVVRRSSGTSAITVEVGRDIAGWVELIEGDLKAGDEIRVGQ